MKYSKRGTIIDKDILKRDYIKIGLRKRALAKKNNTSVHIINNSIKYHNLTELRERYIRFLFNIGLRQYEIGEIVNRDQAAISRLLIKMGVDGSLTKIQRTKETMIERYGEDNCQKVDVFRKKSIETCLLKYGVDTPLRIHNCHKTGLWPKISESVYRKIQDNIFNKKIYTFPSGREVFIQGYENLCLDILINIYNENDILTDNERKVPIIRYIKDNKKRLHFPDIYIKSENKIIEVKSTYTLEISKNVLEKYLAAEQQGYKYEIWMFDGKNNLPEIL